MIEMPARTVYVDPIVYDLPNCRARLERMLPHVRCKDVRAFDEAARKEVAQIGQRRHGKDDFGDDAVFIFTAWDEERTWGYYAFREGRKDLAKDGIVCQDALELNSIWGCPFRCAYCGFGRAVRITLDVERFIAGLSDQFARYPWQQLWKFSNMTDLPPFEPQYDAVLPMVRLFAREQNRYLMLFTKSNAVDFLLDAPHNGHTIISWSLSTRTISREIDRRTATMEQRVEAMRRCREAGYHVRARLSPMVPVRNWREEYAELFEMLLRDARPDLVTLELLGWFDFEDLSKLIPREMFDPDCYRAAEEAQEQMRGQRNSPFPHSVHREMYEFCIDQVRRLSPRTPVGLCHGTPQMWDELGAKMGMTPEDYVCNCGPTSVPGNPLMTAGLRHEA